MQQVQVHPQDESQGALWQAQNQGVQRVQVHPKMKLGFTLEFGSKEIFVGNLGEFWR